jgi:hypothetical protein
MANAKYPVLIELCGLFERPPIRRLQRNEILHHLSIDDHK